LFYVLREVGTPQITLKMMKTLAMSVILTGSVVTNTTLGMLKMNQQRVRMI
jgi:hypothetical protein